VNERLERHYEFIHKHAQNLAQNQPKYKNLNKFYAQYLKRWLTSVLPEGKRVLEIGCGNGDTLNAVNPLYGVGLDLSKDFITECEKKYDKKYKFICEKFENYETEDKFDALLLISSLEYLYDIGKVFDKANHLLEDNGRIYISTGNPLWHGIFKMASFLGLRKPECEHLYITNQDLQNLLSLNGFETVYEEMALIVPKYIPIFGGILNWIIPKIPAIRLLCSAQLIVARKIPTEVREYSVSIVVPCHNEEGNIDKCIQEVVKVGTKTELIFVDDGSTDDTAEKVKNSNREDIDIKLISYPVNKGKGYAVKQGFDSAVNDIVVVLDADLTTHPEDLSELYTAFSSGKAEFINCTRMIYPMESGAMKWKNYIGNKLFNILASHVMGQRVSDTLCGTKACFKKDYLYFTMLRDPWGDYDFLFGAAQLRLSLLELPIHYREREAGLSKMNSFKHCINLIKMCFYGFAQIKFYNKIRKLN
jgi:SAM-dependent methyltransferase